MKNPDEEAQNNYVDLAKLTVGVCVYKGVLKATSDLAKIHSLAVQEDRAFGILQTLRNSMKLMGYRMVKTSTTAWLEGVIECESKVQDNLLVSEYVRNSPFADLTGRDMQEIWQVNEEHEFLATKIAFCHDRWTRLRVIVRGSGTDLLEKSVVQAMDTAEAKWFSCIEAIGHGSNEQVLLARMDFQDNLRLRECVEHFEKAQNFFPQAAKVLCEHLPVLLFVDAEDTLLICSYFIGPGPVIDPNLLATCFSNVLRVNFSPKNFKPASVIGASTEELALSEWPKNDVSVIDVIRAMSSVLPVSVHAAIKRCINAASKLEEQELLARSPSEGTVQPQNSFGSIKFSGLARALKTWSTQHTSQALSVALQISWTSALDTALRISPRTAYVDTVIHPFSPPPSVRILLAPTLSPSKQ